MLKLLYLKPAIEKLKKHKITSAQLDAEVILSYIVKKPKEFIYTHPEYKLNWWQTLKFNFLIKKRAQHRPVAHLTGHQEFYGLDFKVNKHTLIPRPETEMLVDEVINLSENNDIVADIGTGSGCIAIALAKNLPQAKIIATDISKHTLKIAKHNAKKHKVKINFKHGHLLKPVKNKSIDIIVSNPPYLPHGIWNIEDRTSDGELSIQYEPKKALYAGKDGLKYYKKIFNQIIKYNLKPKLIILEIGKNQAKQLKKIIKTKVPQYKIKIKKDLAGLDRLLILEKNDLPF